MKKSQVGFRRGQKGSRRVKEGQEGSRIVKEGQRGLFGIFGLLKVGWKGLNFNLITDRQTDRQQTSELVELRLRS